MVGHELELLAADYQLTIENGIAYGEIEGYTITVFEDIRTKTMDVAMFFDEQTAKDKFITMLNQYKHTYDITEIGSNQIGFRIVFINSEQFLGKITVFIEWLLPLMKQSGAKGAHYCSVCHQLIEHNNTYVITQDIACKIHRGCLAYLNPEIVQDHFCADKQNSNLFAGVIGAVLGGIIGSIPYIIAYHFGWFVGWLGFLIGMGANKGYKLLGGKPNKAKVWIVGGAVVFSVLLGFVVSLVAMPFIMIANGEAEFSYFDIPFILYMMLTSKEVIMDLLPDVGLGLLFAGLGCKSMFSEIYTESTTGTSPKIHILKRETSRQ